MARGPTSEPAASELPPEQSGVWTPMTRPDGRATATRLGRYWLFWQIAKGGMGTVYVARMKASRRGYDRVVALKRIHDHLAREDTFRKMFLDEVRIASRLTHPNVAGVIDFGEDEGIAWCTMDFVVGEALAGVLERIHAPEAPLPLERFDFVAARIVADAAEGLHAAHELRDDDDQPLHVVHRDVSPQNILVGFDGVTRIVDFGVASALHRLHRTATGEFKGKLAYAPPEQVHQDSVDRRADVWSLGCVLWEMVTGKRLFPHEKMYELVDAVTTQPLPALRDVRPDAPFGLDEILWKALQRDPARRYQTTRELARDLNRFLAEEGQAVGPAEVAEMMAALFPGEEPRRRRLLGAVRKAPIDASGPTAHFDAIVSETQSAVRSDEMDTVVDLKRPVPWPWLLGGLAAGAAVAALVAALLA
ncbi:MAG TPA: serine/threonine-protein kinase [Polyangiaceae bacterium LLY-WYZ-15_(1-7)]|nr:serine/threonine-protein kinase [Polyangiaceae bacterium LLY-WYZ-15_(1-7)]HJL02266.1 serine/threonine-protein kinase [Polyangiaceae bacterium LLY-WYZ-15_(1-7)]HJL09296.1 serine/threonine-protein kinase [Polyangiaceae bacterium LLY-WYZ-15_(1-7)]HJL24544.1 serine/threonine-protein kinase [Polyangiaceae bacterium LLY-WYZ-15_(1-7)]HJL31338.1 serine/threonine-protein kinase [Polyangiaceae bacterium LLY-WYZ-15_(1-7)]